MKYWFPAAGLAAACAFTAVALSAAAPPSPKPSAQPAAPVVSYTGCLERVSHNHDKFILANVTRTAPGQSSHPYNVLSDKTLRLERNTDAVDFDTWEGYVVAVTGSLVPHAPAGSGPAYQAPGAKRFAGLPLFDVTSYKRVPGTRTCPA